MRCKEQRLIVTTIQGLMKEPDLSPAQWQYNHESGHIEEIEAIALVKRPPKRAKRGLPMRTDTTTLMRDLSRSHTRPPKR